MRLRVPPYSMWGALAKSLGRGTNRLVVSLSASASWVEWGPGVVRALRTAHAVAAPAAHAPAHHTSILLQLSELLLVVDNDRLKVVKLCRVEQGERYRVRPG